MFNFSRFMNKQTHDLEQDMNVEGQANTAPEQPNAETTSDKVADEMATEADNVSVEPSLEEQIAVWRDK